MTQQILDWFLPGRAGGRVRALRPITPLPLTLDPEDIERLRALGYVE